jgi:hypothetical protein
MRSAAEIDLQPKVLDDIEDLYLKRRELEARIRNVDLLNQLRIEKSALLDIEAYRAEDLRPDCKEPRSACVGKQHTAGNQSSDRLDASRKVKLSMKHEATLFERIAGDRSKD